MKKRILNSRSTWIALLFLLITSVSLAQDSERKGFYASIQPGFVWINEKETSDPLPPTPLPDTPAGTRIAMGLDTQLGWAVKNNLVFHGTLVLTLGESMDMMDLATTVDLLGGGVTTYFLSDFFLTGNIGTSIDNQNNDCCDYSYFENGFSYQLKAGKEWIVEPKWRLGLAIEYGGYSTHYGYVDISYKNTVKRFGFRAVVTLY